MSRIIDAFTASGIALTSAWTYLTGDADVRGGLVVSVAVGVLLWAWLLMRDRREA